MKESFAETFLEFPRDIKYFTDSLGIQVDERTLEEVKTNLQQSTKEVDDLPESLKIENNSESLIIKTTPKPLELERSPDSLEVETVPDSPSTETSESMKSFSIEEDRVSDSPSPSSIMIDSKTGNSIHSLDSGVHSGEICA